MKHNRNILIFCFVFFALVFAPIYQMTIAEEVSNDVVKNRRAELEKEYEDLEAQISGLELLEQSKQKEAASYQRDIEIYNARIQKAKLEIQKLNLSIANASASISTKNSQIDVLREKTARGKESLSELIKKVNEADSVTILEMMLRNKELSDFFVVADSFAFVQQSIHDSLEEIRENNNKLNNEVEELEEEKEEKNRLRAEQEISRKSLAASEADKKHLLSVTEEEKKNYKKLLTEKQKEAAKIRSALFALRDTAAIPFGEAYSYALEAQKKTGVRPAFLLAILTQESNLGENTGQCLVTNFKTGDGEGKNTGRIFKGVIPTKENPSKYGRDDATPFLSLASKLGFDPKTKPVSCPQPGGYGGAMGPSQFIPSTWISYEKRISAATGVAIPDPWIPKDAFFASALYLADLGADKGVYSAEHEAAARYYAGGNWHKSSGQGYGTSVMNHARNIQENMINPLNMY